MFLDYFFNTGWYKILNIVSCAYIYSSKTIPKDVGGNPCKFILWGHYHPDIKTRWIYHIKSKLQDSISYDYRWKYSPQSISKWNLIIH